MSKSIYILLLCIYFCLNYTTAHVYNNDDRLYILFLAIEDLCLSVCICVAKASTKRHCTTYTRLFTYIDKFYELFLLLLSS